MKSRAFFLTSCRILPYPSWSIFRAWGSGLMLETMLMTSAAEADVVAGRTSAAALLKAKYDKANTAAILLFLLFFPDMIHGPVLQVLRMLVSWKRRSAQQWARLGYPSIRISSCPFRRSRGNTHVKK